MEYGHLKGLGTLLLLAVVAMLAALVREFAGRPPSAHPYEAIPELLTAAERSFFGVLQQTLGNDYLLFTKVRLADVVRPLKGLGRKRWQSAFNCIQAKHVDFVLCDPGTLRVVGVIELDDS